jgi:hypothetical protein
MCVQNKTGTVQNWPMPVKIVSAPEGPMDYA